MAQILVNLFPDDRLQARLLPNGVFDRTIQTRLDARIAAGTGSLKICFPEEFGWTINSFTLCSIKPAPLSAATLEFGRACLGEEGWKEFFMFHPEGPIHRAQRKLGVDVFEPPRNALSLFVRKDAGVLRSRLKSISGAKPSRAELASLDGFLRNRQAIGFAVDISRFLVVTLIL